MVTLSIYIQYIFSKNQRYTDCEYLFWYYSLCLLEKKDMSNLKFDRKVSKILSIIIFVKPNSDNIQTIRLYFKYTNHLYSVTWLHQI